MSMLKQSTKYHRETLGRWLTDIEIIRQTQRIKDASNQDTTCCVDNISKLKKHKHAWGCEFRLHNDSKYCMSVLEFSANTKGSRHYHANKEETMLVVKGLFAISGVSGEFKTYQVGDFVTFTPWTPHQIKCIKAGWLVGASTYHDDNDVVRIKNN